MSRSKHTEAAIIAALKQVEAGRKVEDVAREQGVSKHTVYAWKAKYGGMDVSEAEEVKHLRDENARLKKLVADLSLDKDMLQSVIRKTRSARSTKGRSEALAGGVPCQRAPRLHPTNEDLFAGTPVCELIGVPRVTYRYQSRRNDDALRERLVELAREKPRYGYRRLHVLLRREAIEVNHKKVQRVYRELGLTVKRRRRKRLERALLSRPVLTAPNQEWSIDFASDVTAGSQRIRVLSVIDSFTKQSLALEVDTSFPSRRVTRVLDRTIGKYGKPQAIRCDNGPELTSRHFLAWAIENKIDILHIRPGKPTENAYVESFHGRLRDECLNTSWFWNLFDARRKISAWQQDYNSQRPHSSLGYRTPEEFTQQWLLACRKQNLHKEEIERIIKL